MGKESRNPSSKKQQQIGKTKPVRRAKMNRRVCKQLRIFYSNVQGFTGKKTSIQDIVQTVDCGICLLTETI